MELEFRERDALWEEIMVQSIKAWKQLLIVAGVLSFSIGPVRAQVSAPAGQKAEFDVVSVKLSHSKKYWYTVAPTKNGQLTARSISVKHLISLAYQVDEFRVVGGPSWLESDKFDIDARIDPAPPDGDLHLYVRSMLEDRFHLKVHAGSELAPASALVVAGKGPKLQFVESRDCPPGVKPAPGYTGVRFAGRGLTAEHVTMPTLARALTGILRVPVIDQTGLDGYYDFKLDFVDDGAAEAGGGAPAAKPAELNVDWIYSALPQQLGIRLKSTKTQLDVVSVDKIEKPSEN